MGNKKIGKMMKLNILFLVLAHFTIVGAVSNTTGNATLTCTENWNCNVTAIPNTSKCIVASKIENIGDTNVTTTKSFESATAGDVMLKGDDCNAICANCAKCTNCTDTKSSASSLSLYGLGIAGTMAL